MSEKAVAAAWIVGICGVAAAVLPVVLSGGSSGQDDAGASSSGPRDGIVTTATPVVLPSLPVDVESFLNGGGVVAEEETSVFLDRDSGPAGTVVLVSGEGFASGERIDLRYHVETVGRTRANAAGRFSGVQITIPSSYAMNAPLALDVVASGERSLRSARAKFTVSG